MTYTPEQGDIILLQNNPQMEQKLKDKSMGLVVSNHTFNKYTKIALVCPITPAQKHYPLHIPLDIRTQTTGIILCESINAVDLAKRNGIFIEKVPRDIIEEVVDIVSGFIEILK
jgi:mRNA interferase MazF